MKKKLAAIFVVIVAIAAIAYFAARNNGAASSNAGTPEGAAIRVVAAENFYGNIAAQLGGNKVAVTSILSDPDVDPHEYESSVQDGVSITRADIVIENGLEYDSWMDKLLAASPDPARLVIIAGEAVPDVLPDNPHVWYGVDNMSMLAENIVAALSTVDPADSSTFNANLTVFDASLIPIEQKMDEIRASYAGTPVGLTETIYLYQSQPMGLNVLTPFDFEKAIAEGNDPSAQSVDTTDQEVSQKQIKVLIYNSQTVTPITTNLLNAAGQNNIPVVPVTETMPANDTYQSWMMAELGTLESALAQSTGH